MVNFIKPPFFNTTVTPGARGLAFSNPVPTPAPFLTPLLVGGVPSAIGQQESRSDFEYTLPASYHAGDPIQVIIDHEFTSANAINKIGALGMSIDGSSVEAASYSVTGVGPLPGS